MLVRADGTTTEVPVDRVDDVLDSTGAGDAFAAGYIVAALQGADPRESARAGSVLAMGALRRRARSEDADPLGGGQARCRRSSTCSMSSMNAL